MGFVDCRACAERATPRCARGHENPVPGARPSRMARPGRRTSPSASARRRPSAMPGDPSDRARRRDTNRAFGPTRNHTKTTTPPGPRLRGPQKPLCWADYGMVVVYQGNCFSHSPKRRS